MIAAAHGFTRIDCSEHMLNAVLSHAFHPEKLSETPDVRGLISGVKQLVRYFKHSGLKMQLSKNLKQEVSTRWNSTLTMLKSVEEVYDEVHHIVESRDEIYRMAGIDRKLLLELISLLAVFKEASDD